jgi:transposase
MAARDDWLAWVSPSRLAPFVNLARTIRGYRTSIEATIESKLTRGIAESNNAAVGRMRSAACGFQDRNTFIIMILSGTPGHPPPPGRAGNQSARVRFVDRPG